MAQNVQEVRTSIILLTQEIDQLRRKARKHLFNQTVLRNVESELGVRLRKVQELKRELDRENMAQGSGWIPARYLPAALEEPSD